MQWKNNQYTWGGVTIFIHWLSAVVIIGLFALGLWMVELTYYDTWYTKAPHLHKSIGILLFLVTLVRLFWKWWNPTPMPLAEHSQLEKRAAHLVHYFIYILLFLIMLSGYLISTADGKAIQVFNWFEIPATLYGIDKQEDIAGVIHFYLAIALIALACLHALGALKHHILDKDVTLKRMIGIRASQGEKQ